MPARDRVALGMQLEAIILRWVNQPLPAPWLEDLALALNQFLPAALFLGAALWLLWAHGSKGRWLFWGLALLLLFTDWFTTQVLRELFERPRPYLALEGVRYWSTGAWHLSAAGAAIMSHGFPSAHAANTMGPAVYMLRFSRRLGMVMAGLAVAVGLLRAHLGLHFPGDVLAGWAWGGLCGWGLALAMNRVWPQVVARGRRWPFTSARRWWLAGFAALAALAWFVYAPAAREALWQYSLAARGLIDGGWTLLPGNLAANLSTPALVAALAWVEPLPPWLAGPLWALATAAVALAALALAARVAECGPIEPGFLWSLPLAGAVTLALLPSGPAAFLPALAALAGLGMLLRGQARAGACCWGLAAALDPSLAALLPVLALRRRPALAALMAASAALAFVLPDFLFPTAHGGSYALDYISKSLLHLPAMDPLVSNHLLGPPAWAEPASGPLAFLLPGPPLAAATGDLLRALASLPGLWLMARARSLPGATAAALCVAALWSPSAVHAGAVLLLPCFVLGSAAWKAAAGRQGPRLPLAWALTCLLGLAAWAHLLASPWLEEAASLLPPELAAAALLAGLLLLERRRAPGAGPAGREQARGPLWAAFAAALLLAVSLGWAWRLTELRIGTREFLARAPAVEALLAAHARQSGGVLPAMAPLPPIGGLRADAGQCAAPRGMGGAKGPWRQGWNIVYQLGGYGGGEPWACLQYLGPWGRRSADPRAWDPAWRAAAGRGQPLPGGLNRLWCLRLDGRRLPEPVVAGEGGLCRSRYRDGVHLGTVRGGRCVFSWGGEVVASRHFERLPVGAGAWAPGPALPPPPRAVVAGHTPRGGLQTPCRVRAGGRTIYGKAVRDRCLHALEGREVRAWEFEMLVEAAPVDVAAQGRRGR